LAEQLMTVREVAEYLSVHPRTVLRLIERGELKASKIASRWRVSMEDVRDYMERQSAPAK